MHMTDIKAIADAADKIVDGYVFTLRDGGISVINLYHPERVSFCSGEAVLLESSMDDIELAIVRDYLKRNREFLEADAV